MIHNRKKALLYILAILPASYAATTYASLNCSHARNGTANAIITAIPTASVTPDLPVGTTIFQGRVMRGERNGTYTECKRDDPGATTTDQVEIKVFAIVKDGKLSGIDDHTYKTNIDGIGVRYWIHSGYINSSERDITPKQIDPKAEVPPNGIYSMTFQTLREMTFWLVKTGPVAAGRVNGASFPRVEYTAKSVGPAIMHGLPNIFQSFTFSGSYPITVPSCQTPATVNVNLGNFTSTSFTSKPNTDWKDASIRLTNCGTFTGYQPLNGDSQWNQVDVTGKYDVANSNLKPYTDNLLGVTLNGNQGNIDTNNGIVNIKTGPTEAKGVAVQIAKGTNGSNVPMVLAKESTQKLERNGVSAITIPLVVRLIKQGSVSAGRVNSQITYTINYR